MLTIIGSLIGFGTSALPRVFDMFDEWQDRKHEKEMHALNIDAAKVQSELKLTEIEAHADIQEAKSIYKHDQSLKDTGWVGTLRASVRPIISYLLLLLYMSCKAVQLWAFTVIDGGLLVEAAAIIYTEYDQAMLSCVISFWFGARHFQKSKSA